MSRALLLSVSLLLLVALPCLTYADSLVNPGFETGDFTGWTQGAWDVNDTSSVVSFWDGQTLDYTAPEGRYFAVAHSWINSHIYQTLNLDAGQRLSGWAAIDLDASSGSGALAWVSVRDNSDDSWTTIWEKSFSDLPGGYSSLDWETWSWEAPHAGSYQLTYVAYGEASSEWVNGLFDGAIEDSTVPEPGSLALLAMALPVGWVLRRRKSR